MRAWLYDLLAHDSQLQVLASATSESWLTRVMPRESRDTVNIDKPYLVYGLGNNTNEDLAEDTDHEANRQFFTIWIHDEGGDYQRIDDIIPRLKKLLVNNKDKASKVTTVRWLETSQEFANDTYNTIFRYVRFQAIISSGKAVA